MLQVKYCELVCSAALLAIAWTGCAESPSATAGAIAVDTQPLARQEQATPPDVPEPTLLADGAAPRPTDLGAKLTRQRHKSRRWPTVAHVLLPGRRSFAENPERALSKREEALCKVKVGDTMPDDFDFRKSAAAPPKLADLLGKKATVVVFWKGDRRMALEELADLGPDVIEPFGKDGVAVVGIAVNESAESAQEALTKAGAKFTNLLDADGKAFAQVGSERLPRTYVLDPNGKIVWFDIEYSLTTRRELGQTLRAITTK